MLNTFRHVNMVLLCFFLKKKRKKKEELPWFGDH